MLRKRSQTQRSYVAGVHLHETSGIGKTIDTESRLLIAKGWGKGGIESDCLRVWHCRAGVSNSFSLGPRQPCGCLQRANYNFRTV